MGKKEYELKSTLNDGNSRWHGKASFFISMIGCQPHIYLFKTKENGRNGRRGPVFYFWTVSEILEMAKAFGIWEQNIGFLSILCCKLQSSVHSQEKHQLLILKKTF